MISRGLSRATVLDFTFLVGLLVMVVIAYRQRQHPLRVSLGYLYLYAIVLLCVLALFLNFSGMIWNGASLALRTFEEEEFEGDSEGMQALLSTLPLVRQLVSTPRSPAFYTRTELLQRLARGAAATVGMGGLLLLHLWWRKRMAQRVGDSPIIWGYRYALVLMGFLLFLSYAQDFFFTLSDLIGGAVDWGDDLEVRYWVRDLIGYGLNGGVALAIWLLSWRKVWRSMVATSADLEEEHAG